LYHAYQRLAEFLAKGLLTRQEVDSLFEAVRRDMKLPPFDRWARFLPGAGERFACYGS
jgi:hypothetical protein